MYSKDRSFQALMARHLRRVRTRRRRAALERRKRRAEAMDNNVTAIKAQKKTYTVTVSGAGEHTFQASISIAVRKHETSVFPHVKQCL